MRRFIIKTISILSPFVLILLSYIIYDPFRVIWEYNDYMENGSGNAAYTSYKILTKEDSIPFNSFIIGSSRSQNWPWKEWEKYLDSTACAFHLDQSGDGVLRALERIQFIYNHVERVENILLIVDHEWLSSTDHPDDIQFRNPWQMRPNKDYLDFQIAAFKFFFSEEGFKKHFHIGEEFRYNLPSYRDERNEPHSIGREWAITCDPKFYYENLARQHIEYYRFKQRDSIEKIGEPVISERGIEQLSQINGLLKIGNTDFKIIISPLYDQLKLNPADKSILDSIFGSKNVFDYSGINKYTADSLNYYEASHYRPHVAAQILEEIYTQ